MNDKPQPTPFPREVRYFGRYLLLGELGRGAMGVVYLAEQEGLGRSVAIKMIDLEGNDDGARIDRFLAEAKAIAALDHPNIVKIIEVGVHEGTHFFSMEYVEGGNLQEVIDAAGEECGDHLKRYCIKNASLFSVRSVVELLAALARALEHAHARGIIHRDLKPSNILVEDSGAPRITDFGIAKNLGSDSRRTVAGAIFGTPFYMSPEQAAGQTEEITGQSDVFSLGVILYQLLSGRLPHGATKSSREEVLAAVQTEEAIPPKRINPVIDRDLNTLCLHCLYKEPARRYRSAKALAEDLENWLGHRPIKARPASTPEKCIKWVKRNEVLAFMIGVLVLSLITGFSVSLQHRRRAEASDILRKASGIAAVFERVEKDLDTTAGVGRAVFTLCKALEADPEDRELQERVINLMIHRRFLVPLPAGARDLVRIPSAVRGSNPRVVVSRSGRLVMSATNSDRITAWEVGNSLPRRFFQPTKPSVLRSLALDGAGEFVAAGLDNGTVDLWRVASGAHIRSVSISNSVVALAFAFSEPVLAVGAADGALRLIDIRSGRNLVEILTGARAISSLAFSPIDRLIAVCDEEGFVSLWNWGGFNAVAETKVGAGSEPAQRLEFSEDGRTLICFGSDGEVQALRLSLGEMALAGPATHLETARAFAPFVDPLITATNSSLDGKFSAAGSSDHSLRIWGTRLSQPMLRFLPNNDIVSRLAFSPDGKRLATATAGRRLRLWSVPEGLPLSDSLRMESPITALAFHEDGLWMLTDSNKPKRIHRAQGPAPEWLWVVVSRMAGVDDADAVRDPGNVKRYENAFKAMQEKKLNPELARVTLSLLGIE
ncbi:MAG: protein kinase [Verrucomicrobia bacterium]|nr:protein kinase [Verrucomicrobiota bacterium]